MLRTPTTGSVISLAVIAALLGAGGPAGAAPAPADWDARQTLATSGNLFPAGQIDVASGTDGTTATTWQESNGDVFVSVREAGRTRWGPAFQLDADGAHGSAYAPRVSVGSDGTVAAAFPTLAQGTWVRVRPAGSTSWSAPHPIGTRGWGQVSVAPDGGVTAVGMVWDGANQLQSHYRPPGAKSGWRAPRRVNPAGVSAHKEMIATTADGRMVMSWQAEQSSPIGVRLQVAYNDGRGGAWYDRATVSDLIPGGPSHTVALGPQGRTVVAWSPVSTALQARTRASLQTGWSAVRDVAVESTRLPHVSVNGAGASVLLWETINQIRTSAQTTPTGAWSSPVTLETQGTNVYGGRSLAGGTGGETALAWGSGNSVTRELKVRYHSPGGWSGSTTLSPASDPAGSWDNASPVVDVSPDGRHTAVWVRVHPSPRTSTIVTRSTPVGPLALRSQASIAGTPRVGSALTCASSWSNAATRSYTWTVGSTTVGRGARFTPAAAHLGKQLRCAVTVTGPGGPLTSTSASSAAVIRGLAPKVRKRPRVVGTAKAGKTVRVTAGKWKPAATPRHYRWRVNGSPVAGRKGAGRTFAVRQSHRGKRLTVVVTVERPGHATGRATTAARTVKRR